MEHILEAMEHMNAAELCEIYKNAQRLIPLRVTPDDFGLVIGKIFGGE